MQVVSHTPLLAINFPLNEHKFLAFLNRVVSFDLFRPKPLIGAGFSASLAHNDHFYRLGYTTSNIIENLGAVPIFGYAYAIFVILKLILMACSSQTSSTKVKRTNNFISFAKINNFGVRLVLVTFFEYIIVVTVGLGLSKELGENASGIDNIAIVINYMTLFYLCLFILTIAFITGFKGIELS